MSESPHVEKPFLAPLRALGWEAMDQGEGSPDPKVTLRESQDRDVRRWSWRSKAWQSAGVLLAIV